MDEEIIHKELYDKLVKLKGKERADKIYYEYGNSIKQLQLEILYAITTSYIEKIFLKTISNLIKIKQPYKAILLLILILTLILLYL